jgi:Beta-lactamase enzyme family
MVSPAGLNHWLQALNQWQDAGTGAKLVSIKVDAPSMVVAIVSAGSAVPRARVGLTVDSRGLIGDLDISPAITDRVRDTWAGVDATLARLPQPRLPVADVSDGSCQPLHSIDPDSTAPFGSVLKLYVLYALGNAVAAGKVRWDQPLTVTTKLESLPSGVLQNEPDGTQISVLDAATKMITISDNTATDMLINLVGRSAVEEALRTTGMSNPALDRPFLTTSETSILTLEQSPTPAKHYLAAKEAGRQALLAHTVDRLPLPQRGGDERVEREATCAAWDGSARPAISAMHPPPWLNSVADRACPRSARCFRSTMTSSSSTRPSGRPPGAKAELRQGSWPWPTQPPPRQGRAMSSPCSPRTGHRPSTETQRPRSSSRRPRARSCWRRDADIRVSLIRTQSASPLDSRHPNIFVTLGTRSLPGHEALGAAPPGSGRRLTDFQLRRLRPPCSRT